MESKRPWYLPQQYLTNRWQQLHPTNSQRYTKQVSLGNRSQNSQNNYRNLSSSGMSNSLSSLQYQVQQLCLQDNKLLILDAAQGEREAFRPYTNACSYRNLRKNKYQQCLPTLSKTSKSQFLKTQGSRQKLITYKKSEATFRKDQNNRNSQNEVRKTGFLKKRTEKGKQLKLKFTDQPSLKVTINAEEYFLKIENQEQNQENQANLKSSLQPPPEIERSKRSIKSTKSVKSVKSVKSTKSFKSQKSQKSSNSFKKKQTPAKTQKSNQKTVKSHQKTDVLSEIAATESQPLLFDKKDIDIAECFDRAQYLDLWNKQRVTMSNPYDDFPEWGKNQANKQSLDVSQNYTPSCEENAFERTKSFGQKYDLNLLSCRKQEPEQKRQSIVQSKLSIFSEKQHKKVSKRCISMTSLNNNTENMTQRRSLRCPNAEIHFSFDAKEIKNQFRGSVITQKQNQNPSIQVIPPDRSALQDKIEMKDDFSPSEGVRFIQIKITPQTAYFPSSLKTPVFITPNPSSSFYSNLPLINILNLFLKVSPLILKHIFSSWQSSFYQCFLSCQQKSQNILVDDYFPYDSNFYPLFGSVDQYIWFSVLVKVLAKIKGSFKLINFVSYHEIFSMITSCELEEANSLLLQSKEPLKLLSSLISEAESLNLFILVVEGDQFFKLGKMFYKKPQEQRKQQQEEQMFSRKSKMRRSSTKEVNMKSLALFIKEQKGQISLQRTMEYTTVRLIGAHQTRCISLRQLLNQNLIIYRPVALQRKVY